jgi:hypothetical protein
MHQVQEWIDAQYAVRLTVVDQSVFAAAILPGSVAARVDWRSDYGALSYERIDRPASVAAGVFTLCRRLGLRFGVLDFLVDGADRWWFLKIGASEDRCAHPQVRQEKPAVTPSFDPATLNQ